MKIVSISIVRNESDIIEAFIRYHLRLFDHMIVVNHRSIDSTLEILENLYKEGLPIEIINDNSIEQPQDRVLTQMMKKAVKDYGADWVFPHDADEFVVYSGNGDIRDRLSGFFSDTVYRIYFRTYVPTFDDNPEEINILKKLRHRKIKDPTKSFKILIPGDIAGRRDTNLSFGCHRLLKSSFLKKREWHPVTSVRDIYIAHFPVRSEEQIITKAITGWLCNLARANRKEGDNVHHRDLFYKFISKNRLTYDDLRDIALNYAYPEDSVVDSIIYDPVISPEDSMVLKYTKGYECDPWKILGMLAEEFASEVGRLKKNSDE